MLSALYECYERLLKNPDSGIAPPEYSVARVAGAIVLKRSGGLISIVPLGTEEKGRNATISLIVPDQAGRSGTAPNPYFLCDNPPYLLGVGPDGTLALDKHLASADLHRSILAGVPDEGARAVVAFLDTWNPSVGAEKFFAADRTPRLGAGNLVFRLEGDDRYVHQREAVRHAWHRHQTQSDGALQVIGQCLVTGRTEPIARLHKMVKGVRGAASTGASLVGFNFPAVESYGRSQGENAPVSERAAFGCITALNYLLGQNRHRLDLNGVTVVAWAERSGPEEDMCLALFGDAAGRWETDDTQRQGNEPRVDRVYSETILDVLSNLRAGRPVPDSAVDFERDVRFYILGLSGNRARISVRFWLVNTVGSLLSRLAAYFADMAIIGLRDGKVPPIRQLLLETAPLVDRNRDRVPVGLEAAMATALLQGTQFPQAMYSAILSRMRSDSESSKTRGQKISAARAALVKAYLIRKGRLRSQDARDNGGMYMLDLTRADPAYLLGRLFALMEKAQADANPGINATIKDRYYASASSTPAVVFPMLLRLTQHHLAKSDYAPRIDGLIQSVMQGLNGFPVHLNLDEQGMFVLGYYHQRQALYARNDSGGAQVG